MRSVLTLCALTAATALAASEPARPSPPLAMNRLGAPPLQLAQYRGKVVALALILTTCSHCQDLTKVLNQLAPVYGPRGVQFLECAFNGDAQSNMKEFLDRFQPHYPVGWTTQEAVRAYLRMTMLDPRPLYAPHMVFLDRRGVIRAEGQNDFFNNSEANIRAELEKLLKPTAARR